MHNSIDPAAFLSILKLSGRAADVIAVTTADDIEQRELMLNRFRRLLGELIKGSMTRNTFEPWEIEVLLDFHACELPPRRRLDILRQYERAVERQLEAGQGETPLLLSHFLVLRERRRDERSGE
jgi:hypothetical protein